jgi:hypothetical protein
LSFIFIRIAEDLVYALKDVLLPPGSKSVDMNVCSTSVVVGNFFDGHYNNGFGTSFCNKVDFTVSEGGPFLELPFHVDFDILLE